jgi:hypothetical protein
MQFAKLAVLAGLAASVSAWTNETWVTTTVDVFTTVCPFATQLTFNGVTYTATASETITVTNCPCTLSYYKPAHTPGPAPPVYSNTTKPAPVGTGSPVATPVATKHALTGAANRAAAGSAAGLAGLLVAAAYLL